MIFFNWPFFPPKKWSIFIFMEWTWYTFFLIFLFIPKIIHDSHMAWFLPSCKDHWIRRSKWGKTRSSLKEKKRREEKRPPFSVSTSFVFLFLVFYFHHTFSHLNLLFFPKLFSFPHIHHKGIIRPINFRIPGLPCPSWKGAHNAPGFTKEYQPDRANGSSRQATSPYYAHFHDHARCCCFFLCRC